MTLRRRALPVLAVVVIVATFLGIRRIAAPAKPRQRASVSDVNALNADQIESLVLLNRVWGFLKYHHPRIAGGEMG